jgi:chaperonin GroES
VIAKIKNNNKIKMNLKPLSNHILIEPLEEEKVSKGGIVLPDTVEKEKPVKGKIIATGPGKINENGEVVKMSVKVGDVVLFKKYGPDEFEIEGKKYLIGDEDDVLATIE